MGTLLRRCMEVRTAIKLSFGVVSCGPRHSCVRWKSTCLKGKGLFLAWFSAFCEIFVQYFTMATYGYTDMLIDNRLVCEKSAVFPYTHGICLPLNSVLNSLSFDIVRFKIEVGVEEKCM